MLRVGLTGGIGAGKSTAARRLEELGAVLVDADAIAREVVAPGTPGLAAVVERFGVGVLTPEGSLDRQALGRVVFGDPAQRRRLNEVVHPLVARRRAELSEAAPPGSIIVEDVPLLVENGMGAEYHLVAVVHAPVAERRRRLVSDRGMAPQDADARIAAQADDRERLSAADAVLDNAGSPQELLAQVDSLWRERLVPFADNLRSGRRVHGPPLALLPHQDRWAGEAARALARVVRAAGGAARGAEHVGSTAVPGLAAKDVLDLQLSVPSLRAADAVASDLAAAGFPRAPGEWWDAPKPPEPDPSRWRKRLHGGADPARPVHLHVRVHGSPGWRWALLFRDWLRADAAARDHYADVKRELAERCADAAQYAEAKEPWFTAVAHERAERWAEGAGWRPPAG
ncbi:dephospho-CoA kinase [Kineococcus esterisolvens]|uniref:dephospho-CoA kinase n=1 Tax=unclassified Kineococcus TaxID=2621656 RepID=UPI003D7D65B1